MKTINFIISTFLFLSVSNANAQGCVAVRGFGGCGVAGGSGLALAPKQWQVGANYRYFKSFRHFKGDEEQYDRLVKQTQVINHSNTLDLSASMGLTLRTQLNVSLPVSYTWLLYTADAADEFTRVMSRPLGSTINITH